MALLRGPKQYSLSSTVLRLCAASFSSTSIHKSPDRADVEELKKKKGDLVKINPDENPYSYLPYVEQRKLEEDLVHEEELNFSYLGDVPQEHVQDRLAMIFRVPKNCMQSGTNNTHTWRIQFDNRQRWENNLMGWVSSGDPLSNHHLDFPSKETAVHYCQRYKYPYFVQKENSIASRKKSYGAIFSWNKRTRSSTK